MLIKALWQSPALRAAFVIGFGGLGFALGSLLLARAMVPTEYAWVIFCLSLGQIATGMGHLGASTLVVRHVVNPDKIFLMQILGTSFVAAVLLAAVSVKAYGMPSGLAMVLLVYCLLSSTNKVSADFLRSRQEFGLALLLIQIHNAMLLFVGGIAIFSGIDTAIAVSAVLVIALAGTSIVGWSLSLAKKPRADAIPRKELPWGEGMTFVAIDTAVILLIALERLVIPKVLDLGMLATFAVLAAVVGSPFRVLQMGVGFTLTPRLKAAESVPQRRKLVIEETGIVLIVLIVACFAIWALAPWIVRLILSDKYTLGPALIAAGMFSGFGKVFGAIGTSIITAVGDKAALKRLNALSWLSLAIGLAGAILGAEWGLVGVVAGVAVGWFAYAVCALGLSIPSMRQGPSFDVSKPSGFRSL